MVKKVQVKSGTIRRVDEDRYHFMVTDPEGREVSVCVDNLYVEGALIEVGYERTDISGACARYAFTTDELTMKLEF